MRVPIAHCLAYPERLNTPVQRLDFAKIATLTFDKALHFDALIAWFVGEVTGNRNFTLPDPWDSVLGAMTTECRKSNTATLGCSPDSSA